MPLGPTQATNLSVQEGILAGATTFESVYVDLFRSSIMPGEYSKYCRMVDGKTLQYIMMFAANHPTMAKWLGPRVEKFCRTYSQTINLDPYVATLPIKRMLLQYEGNLGVVADMIQTFLQSTVFAYDGAASTALDGNTGAGPTGFDGVALFSASHPHAPAAGTQSNLAAGTALSWAAFDAGRKAMAGWKFENGEPARFKATHMRVGVSLETRAKEILSATQRVVAVAADALEAGTRVAATTIDNVWKGELELIVDQRIPASGTGAFYWDLMDLSKPGVRPIIGYVGRAPEPQHQDSMDSDRRFQLDEFLYGLEGDFSFNAGHWMSCYRGTGTA